MLALNWRTPDQHSDSSGGRKRFRKLSNKEPLRATLFARSVEKTGDNDVVNPRKPHHLKVLAGTTRKDRDGVAGKGKPSGVIPKPPSWLPVHCQSEFTRLAGVIEMGESTPTLLAQYLSIEAQFAKIFAEGKLPSGHALSQFRHLAKVLGLGAPAKSTGQERDLSKNSFFNNWSLLMAGKAAKK